MIIIFSFAEFKRQGKTGNIEKFEHIRNPNLCGEADVGLDQRSQLSQVDILLLINFESDSKVTLIQKPI